jgi:two-component system NtrC family sensor kinase
MMITEYGMRASELVKGSTRHSMLLNHKEDTYHIIRTLAEQHGVEKIRIYNKSGTIIFSADDSEIGQTVDMKNEACYMCHKPSGDIIQEPLTNEQRRIFTRTEGSRSLGFVTSIKNEESCYQADCHFHKRDEMILGTLDVILSLKETDEIIKMERSQMITANIAVTLFLALAVGIFIWFFVHIPVRKLIIGMKEISSGNLDNQIHVRGKDEIGILASSFNEMTGELRKAKKEITDWSDQLEQRVKDKTTELENTQERNLQIEKMASLGQLSATVAHELNNPMAGILTYSKLIQKKLNKEYLSDEDKESVLKNLKMIETESARSGDIIKNMLLFSRQEAVDMKPGQINEIIDASLELISHHLHLHNISLEREYAQNLPPINVDKNQITQALLALCVNAVEAMENNGRLIIRTTLNPSEKNITIYVKDTGKGMTDEVKSQIFEPFFTTKNEVKGVGLGLSSVYAIIQRHQGDILVESELDKGTTFIIKLPLKSSKVDNL